MVPLRLIYFYSIMSMVLAGINFALGIMTLSTWTPFLINVGFNVVSMWAYHKKLVKWTFWLSLVYLMFAFAYAYLLFGQFETYDAYRRAEKERQWNVTKWGYPILLTGLSALRGSLVMARVLWIMTYVAANKLFPSMWKTIDKHHERIRKMWPLHVVSVVPTLLLIYKETSIFVRSGKGFLASKENTEDITYSTLSFLLICALWILALSNGFLYFGLRKERPSLIRLFLIFKALSSWVTVALLFGTTEAYRVVSPTLVPAGNSAMFMNMLDVFPYFYMVKLKEGWSDKRSSKGAWCLPIVELKRLTDIQTDPLGTGHTSTVYKCLISLPTMSCFSKKQMIPAAVKHFNILVGRESICQEFSTLTRIYKLKHSNVVVFYGICIDDQRLSAVFELCDNGSLKDFLGTLAVEAKGEQQLNQMVIEQLHCWSADVAKGMDFLSENDIIHGDLAARNVLLSNILTAKIADFGLAHKLYGSKVYERLGEFADVPWKWMAPEVLVDWAVQKPSDVWSYGLTLWEIFSLGKDPWDGYEWDSRFSTLLQHGIKPSCPPHATHEFYNKCMLRCWELDPACRPTFKELLDSIPTTQRLWSKICKD